MTAKHAGLVCAAAPNTCKAIDSMLLSPPPALQVRRLQSLPQWRIIYEGLHVMLCPAAAEDRQLAKHYNVHVHVHVAWVLKLRNISSNLKQISVPIAT